MSAKMKGKYERLGKPVKNNDVLSFEGQVKV